MARAVALREREALLDVRAPPGGRRSDQLVEPGRGGGPELPRALAPVGDRPALFRGTVSGQLRKRSRVGFAIRSRACRAYTRQRLTRSSPSALAQHQARQRGRPSPLVKRRPDSARGKWLRALVLLFTFLLAVPGTLAAQGVSWGLSLTPADDLSLPPAERPHPRRACSEYSLLPGETRDCEPLMASAGLTTGAPLQAAQADAEPPPEGGARKPNHLLGALIPIATLGLVAANSLLGYDGRSFHVHDEGWFGPNTRDGGADKASHFADYYIVSKEIAFVYEKLGYSETAARWLGFGVAVATGLANELADGTTKYGFSWGDLAMDTLGAGFAVLVSVTRTEDLIGVRTSHVPGSTYTHDVYSADMKLSGLARRLGLNLGPLRWLMFSVTYGSKGYRVDPPIDLQRQLGLEIGLNLQQILLDVKVTRDTWWGYALHLVGDNVRFPYTAVGMRVDLNRGKWHGPNIGNFP